VFEDLLPALVTLETNHALGNAPVRLETEEGPAQDIVEELVRFRVVVVDHERLGLTQELFPQVQIHSVFPVRVA
jgi:hypothetical protein